MSRFQIIILGLFAVFIVAGAIAFATFKGGGNSTPALPAITIWGTFPADSFNAYVSRINNASAQPLSISYVQKTPPAFSRDFIAALARGQGPDAILIPADMLLPHLDKITLIPYATLARRDFMNAYVQEGEIYLNKNGILALPFMLDPLVMYWNRDSFALAGLATYPKYWDEFTALVPKLTVKDDNGNIRKSALAMGDFSNVANARELLGGLLLQLGSPVTVMDANGGVESALDGANSVRIIPALRFFTQFANPSNSLYSWNRAMPDSKSAFLSGNLATYFGFASEISDIRAKNPNLNFDVAPLPQVRNASIQADYGRMYGFSIVRSSQNQNGAFQAISVLIAPQSIAQLSQSLYIPSVRRDIIAQGSSDPYITIFNKSALTAKTWLDADPAQSYQIFGNMVNAVTSGSKTVEQAVNDASDQYDAVLKQ